MGNVDGQFLILLDIDKVFNADEAEFVSGYSDNNENIDDRELLDA